MYQGFAIAFELQNPVKSAVVAQKCKQADNQKADNRKSVST